MAGGTPGAEPNNWASYFSGSVWEYDEPSGEYFLHLFSRTMPDLNWENPEVRDAVYAMMRWWLDRGVDGFRMDVINMISKDLALPDGHVHDGRFGDGGPHYLDGPRIHEFLQELHREVLADRPQKILTVGEMPGVTVDEARLYTDPSRGEVDMVFQFEHVGIDHAHSKWDLLPFRLTDLKASLGHWQVGLDDLGWNSLYWNNHDQPRVVSRFGDDGAMRVRSAKLLATVLHLHRGTPYVYQGEELGMTNFPFESIDDFRDIESVNHYTARHGRRCRRRARPRPRCAPEAATTPGRRCSGTRLRTPASPTASRGWRSTPTTSRSTPRPPRRTPTRSSTTTAVSSRCVTTSPVVALGSFSMLLPEHETVYAFTRSWEGVELLVAANFSGVLGPRRPAGRRRLAGRRPAAHQPRRDASSGWTGELQPWECLVLQRSVTD